MIKPFFKPEDLFVPPMQIYGWHNMSEPEQVMALNKAILSRANALLDAHLKMLPMVYGEDRPREEITEPMEWDNEKFKGATHTAILWGVEEIKE